MGRRHSPESCLSSITYCSVMLGYWLNLSEPHLSAVNGDTFLVGFWGRLETIYISYSQKRQLTNNRNNYFVISFSPFEDCLRYWVLGKLEGSILFCPLLPHPLRRPQGPSVCPASFT